MAENSFAGLTPGIGLDRAEVNRVGEGWAHSDRVERPDYTLNLPFDKVPPRRVVVSPPQPSESELREQLAAAIEAQRTAGETLERAEAAHERAEQHKTRCQQRAAEYAGLDETIAAATIEALRCDAGRLSPDMSEAHELAIDDRARAHAELQAAGTALATFLAERAQASEAYGTASTATDVLVARVLAHTAAEALAVEHEAHLARAATIRTTLVAFDHYRTGRGGSSVVMPPTLQRVWGQIDRQAFGYRQDQSAWLAAADALRADPHCAVTLASPEPQPA
jgi:hypothetical protein